MLGFSSGISCCHQWTGHLSQSRHLLFGKSWLLREEKLEWAVYSTRGEWLLLPSVNLTRAAGEPLECSPGQLLPGRQHKAFRPAQLSQVLEPSKACLLAALLCNITLQYWWPLGFCLLKRSSQIWLKCAFSFLKHYGAGEGKSRVKQAALHTDHLLKSVWSLQWVTETTGFCSQWEVKGSCGAHYHRNSFYQAGLCHKCGFAKYRRKLKCLRCGTVHCWGTRLSNWAKQKVAFTVLYGTSRLSRRREERKESRSSTSVFLLITSLVKACK